MGLGQIQGIGKRTIESILAARPFGCLGDLVVRSHVRIAEAENLIRAGALDFTGRTRPVLMLVLHSIFEKAKRLSAREGLFRIALPTPSLPQVRDYSDVQRFRDEWEMLNLSVHHHPLYEVRPLLDSMKVHMSGNLQGRVGKRIRLAGLGATSRTTATEKGEQMAFVSLSDEEGLYEVTLFPSVWRRHRTMLCENGMGPFIVEGVVEDQYDAITVTARRIQTLDACLHSIRPGQIRRPIPHVPGAGNGFGKRTASRNAESVQRIVG